MILLQLPFWDFFKKIWESEFSPLLFDTGDYLVCLSVSLCLVVITAIIGWLIYSSIYGYVDKKRSTKKILFGELVDKKYIGEKYSSGMGTAVIPNTSGSVGIGLVSTSSHSDEKFLFFVKSDKVYKMKVDMQQFYSKKIGEKVRFEVRIGGLSKDEINIELLG